MPKGSHPRTDLLYAPHGEPGRFFNPWAPFGPVRRRPHPGAHDGGGRALENPGRL